MRCLSWSDFKTTCINNKNLKLQYEDLGSQFHVLGPDKGNITWEITLDKQVLDGDGETLIPNPDALDFQNNFLSTSNQSIGQVDALGVPLQAVQVPTSPFYVDTREGVFQSITQQANIIEWKNPYTQIVLFGMKVDIQGTEAGDCFSLVEVGYYYNSNWISIDWFGKNYYFSGGNHVVTDVGHFKSDPMPQGLTMKLTYTFADPRSLIPKPCGVIFQFGRPYGE